MSGAGCADREARCSWCGAGVAAGDGLRAHLAAGGRGAAFCRLEHVVPWVMRGARWEAPEEGEAAGENAAVTACAWCGAPLGARRVLLVRARGEHRVPDGFCDVEHLLSWAKAGGRYRRR
jgi:hypothetical protein